MTIQQPARLEVSPGTILAAGGGAAVVVGSLGPWVRYSIGAFGGSVAGTSGDGAYTLALGIVVVVCAVIAYRASWGAWLGIGCALGALGVAVYDLADLHRVTSSVGSISTGWGLIVTLAGAVMALGGFGVVAWESR